MTDGKKRRGFAAMSPEKQREIASAGGKAAHRKGTAHEFSPEEAREAGRKGGQAVASNRAHMREIGSRGGHVVATDREHMSRIGAKGGRMRGRADEEARGEPGAASETGSETDGSP